MNPRLARYANEILDYAGNSRYSDDEAARRSISAACRGLQLIMDELRPMGRLASDMRLLMGRRDDHQREVAAILEDANAFVNVFIQHEARILRRAGLRKRIVDMALNEAEAVRRDLIEFRGSPEDLRDRLDPLMTDVCRMHEQYVDYRERNPSFLERAGWVIVGAIVISTNATAAVITKGMLVPAATAVSGLLGGHIITKRL